MCDGAALDGSGCTTLCRSGSFDGDVAIRARESRRQHAATCGACSRRERVLRSTRCSGRTAVTATSPTQRRAAVEFSLGSALALARGMPVYKRTGAVTTPRRCIGAVLGAWAMRSELLGDASAHGQRDVRKSRGKVLRVRRVSAGETRTPVLLGPKAKACRYTVFESLR